MKPQRTWAWLCWMVLLAGTSTCGSDTIVVIETTHVATIEDTITGPGFPTQDAGIPPWADGSPGDPSRGDSGPLLQGDGGSARPGEVDAGGSVNRHTPCAVPGFIAGPEICDGIDNDCDGVIDDNAACSDLNPCTVDVCYSDPESAFCVHTELPDGTLCDDDKSCLEGQCLGPSTCGNGLCGPGEDCENCSWDCGNCPPETTLCGNGNCSLEESCSTCEADCGPCEAQCVPGACDDGDPCTVGDTCVGGFCQPGAFALACNESWECQTGFCDPNLGCVYEAFPDDTPCGLGWTCQFGDCTPNTVGPGSIVISEIMANPSEVTDKKGEWFELYNTTTQPIDINGWAVGDASGNIHTIVSGGQVIVPSTGYVVLTLNGNTSENGSISPDYSYQKTTGNPDFYLNNDWDHLTLYWLGMIVDRVDYASGFGWPVEAGISMQLSADALDDDANDDPGFWCLSDAPYGLGDLGTPGGPNWICP